jgi:hypothetical protein
LLCLSKHILETLIDQKFYSGKCNTAKMKIFLFQVSQ